MAANFRDFIIEPPPERESAGLVRLGNTMQENKQWDYRMMRDQEADQFRKANLIQDLTDLSKHQTGSDVANAVGDKLMTDVYQKYTAGAKNMSPLELQAGIQKEMQGVVTGMEGIKRELSALDNDAKVLKQLYPGLDVGSLYNDGRKDVVARRLNDGGTGFRNEMEIKPSSIDLTNPNFLYKYLSNTSKLDEEIANPKGIDPISVAAGSGERNIEYGGKIPYWMNPNYTDKDLENGKGFLPQGFVPKLDIKSEDLPTDFLPALQGQQRKIVTPDVHAQFLEKFPLEVRAGTARMFPNYDEMSDGEKQIAERDYLYNKIKALDKSNFSYKSSKSPSAALLKFYQGGSGSEKKQQQPIDLREYPDTDAGKDVTDLFRGVKVTGLPTGTSLLAERVIYDPATKKVSYKEYTDDKQATLKTVSLTKFMQDIKTLNPGIDMKFLEGLENPITGSSNPGMGKEPTQRTPDLSGYDIPKGAVIKYSSDGKTPLGYELNGKKYKF